MDMSLSQPDSGNKSLTMCEPNINTKGKGKGKIVGSKRQMTKVKDAQLVECVLQLKDIVNWRTDNNTFKVGYLTQLEKMMEKKLPGHELKAMPHIKSRVKLLKRQYSAINDMIEHDSGFS